MIAASYACPNTLEEAVAALADPAAMVIAGGTDLMVKGRTRNSYVARALVDVTGVNEMRGVTVHDGLLDIGAAEPLASLVESKVVRSLSPVLWQAVRSVGGVQTRNRATLGGNLANACPAADGICACVALGALIKVVGSQRERTIDASELFRPCPACLAHEGMLVRTCLFADPREKKTTLEPGELIARVLVPQRAEGELGSYVRLSTNRGIGLASVTASAIVVREQDGTVRLARACVGGVLPAPRALEGSELPLVGTKLENADVLRCSKSLGTIMDEECSRLANGSYKRRVAPVVLGDALRALGQEGEDVPGVPGLRRIAVPSWEEDR